MQATSAFIIMLSHPMIASCFLIDQRIHIHAVTPMIASCFLIECLGDLWPESSTQNFQKVIMSENGNFAYADQYSEIPLPPEIPTFIIEDRLDVWVRNTFMKKKSHHEQEQIAQYSFV